MHDSDDELETIVAAALEALDRGGQQALDELLAAAHVQRASEVRRIVGRVAELGVVATGGAVLPARIGGYRILGELGRGGMGIVYEVADDALGRRLALKIVRPEQLAAPDARDRFAREIAAAAKLSHPAIVPVIGAGEDAGLPFCVMPLLPGASAAAAIDTLAGRDPASLRGEDLRAALGTKPVAADPGFVFAGAFWQAAVRLVRQAALGIAHAHEHGIVHRDLKPSNLMLLPDGRALVLDFGLARLRGSSRLTRTGQEPGSPAYMAPEQLHGHPADERTDVYGLGVSLWHLVTLTPPFPEGDPQQLQQRILAGQPTSLGRWLPAELRLVLHKAIDREREHRYASAEALADDLDAVLQHRPIVARGLPLPVRLRRFAQRHRALAAAAVVAAIAGVLLPLLLWQQERQALAEVLAEKQRADRSLEHALGAVQVFLMRTFAASDRMTRRDALERVDFLEAAIRHLDALAADATALDPRGYLATAHRLLAECFAELGNRAEAERHASTSIAILGEDAPIASNWAIGRSMARRLLLDLRLSAGDTAAIPPLLDAVDRDLEIARQSPSDLAGARTYLVTRHADCLLLRAELARGGGDREGHLAWAEQALRELQACEPEAVAIGDWLLESSRALCEHGDALAALGRTEAARVAYQGVLDLYAKHPDAAAKFSGRSRRSFAYYGIGRLYVAAEDYRASLAPMTESRRLLADLHDDDPDWRENTLSLARRSYELGQIQDAVGERSTARDTLQQTLGLLEGFEESRTPGHELLSVRKRTLDLLGHWALEAGDRVGAANFARRLGALGEGVRNCVVAAQLLLAAADGAPLAGLDVTSCRREALAFLLEAERRGGPGCLDLTAGFDVLQGDAEYASLRERWLTATRGR